MSLQTPFGEAEDSPGLLVWRTTNTWAARQRAALRPYELTHVQFVLLASLAWLQDDEHLPTQSRLAAHARTDPMMTSQVLRTLEAKGLVERRDSPTDRRARALAVTPAGRALANAANAAVEGVDAEFFGVLGDDLPALLDLLRRLPAAD